MGRYVGNDKKMNILRRLKLAYKFWKKPYRRPSHTYMKHPEWSNFNGKKVLNIGCGNTIYHQPNVINTDFYARPGSIRLDLSKPPFPFDDNSFDLILANHILEHVQNWWECFKELARVVKVGGKIEVWLPGDGGSSQLGYRDHINVINYCSFVGIKGTNRNLANAWEEEDRKNLGEVVNLELIQNFNILNDYWWVQLAPKCVLNFAATHLRNVVTEQGFIFEKRPQ